MENPAFQVPADRGQRWFDGVWVSVVRVHCPLFRIHLMSNALLFRKQVWTHFDTKGLFRGHHHAACSCHQKCDPKEPHQLQSADLSHCPKATVYCSSNLKSILDVRL